jgi:uncharacterized membrane protein YbaN (DUF454 family)
MKTSQPDKLPPATPERTASPGFEKRHPLLRALVFAIGIALILFGLLLGFVPFLPGFPFGILGLALVSASSSRVRALLRRCFDWLPKKWRARIRLMRKRQRGTP